MYYSAPCAVDAFSYQNGVGRQYYPYTKQPKRESVNRQHVSLSFRGSIGDSRSEAREGTLEALACDVVHSEAIQETSFEL